MLREKVYAHDVSNLSNETHIGVPEGLAVSCLC